MLNIFSDVEYNRSVITIVGTPENIGKVLGVKQLIAVLLDTFIYLKNNNENSYNNFFLSH